VKPIQLLAVAAAGASLVAVPAFGGTEAPFVVTSPQARSVIEGASAVFAVAADGAQPLAYQWQRSGTELPGANGSSYVTAPVSLADSGAQLRVIITNAFGATTSSWATLTVTAANTITWTGAVSSDWNNPTNWSPRGVPGANDAVLVNSGTLNVAPNASFALLTLDGAATVTGSLRVSSTMNWNSGFVHASLVVEERGVLNLRGPFGRGLGGTLVNGG